MKTYKVVVESHQYEDGTPAFHTCCLALKGARTHGRTRDEALANIREVVKMAIEELAEEGSSLLPDIEALDLAV